MSAALRLAGCLAAISLLAACSRPADEPPREEDKALQRAIEAPQDKARAVEGQLQEDLQRKREAEEAQSEGDGEG